MNLKFTYPLRGPFAEGSGHRGGEGGGQIRHTCTMKMYRIIEFVSLPLAEGDKLIHDYVVHEIFNLYENCEINYPWVRDLGPLFRSVMSTYRKYIEFYNIVLYFHSRGRLT